MVVDTVTYYLNDIIPVTIYFTEKVSEVIYQLLKGNNMFKAMWLWITSIFVKQFIHTAESVGFNKTESVKDDLSQLTITIGGTKSMVNTIEKEMRLKLYQLMAEQAAKDNVVAEPINNVTNVPQMFRHQAK